MKTVVVNLLSMVLVLACSLRCDAKGEDGTCEPSPQQEDSRTRLELPTTPQAIRKALRQYVNTSDWSDTREFNSLLPLGDRILPYIIEAAKAENGKNWRVYSLLGRLLNHCSEDARRETAPKLLELLTDEDTSIDQANGLLIMIGALEEPGLVIESDLIELRRTRPELEDRINYALIDIEPANSGSIYAAWLAHKPSESLLKSLAFRGSRARSAGPAVTRLLSHPNWRIRLAAVETLWRIGCTEAIPALIESLNDPTDVRLNHMAAESLGRLGANSAVEALRKTAVNHWHPAVRDRAKDALEHIVSGKPYKEARPGSPERLSEYFGRSYWGIKSSTPKRPEFLQEPLDLKLRKSTTWKLSHKGKTVALDSDDEAEQREVEEKLRELSYRGETVVLGSDDEAEQREAKEKGATIVVDDGMVMYRMPIEQVPDVALRVENGWLVGRDRGEFGGELVFVPDEGEQSFVLKENVEDLFKLGERYIAVTGLSHLGIHYGCVYGIKPGESGQWVAELWRTLPGAPNSCGKLPSGEIFISTSGGGDVILSVDGTLRMASP